MVIVLAGIFSFLHGSGLLARGNRDMAAIATKSVMSARKNDVLAVNPVASSSSCVCGGSLTPPIMPTSDKPLKKLPTHMTAEAGSSTAMRHIIGLA